MMSALREFILAHAVLLKFSWRTGCIYSKAFLVRVTIVRGVERLGYNRAINRKKYTVGQVDLELNNKKSIRYQIYSRLNELIAVRRGERVRSIRIVRLFLTQSVNIFFKIVRVAENGEKRVTALFNFSNKMQTRLWTNALW